jgi:hypothetical protein
MFSIIYEQDEMAGRMLSLAAGISTKRILEEGGT